MQVRFGEKFPKFILKPTYWEYILHLLLNSARRRLITLNDHNWVSEIQVYDNKIKLAFWNEMVGILIESQNMAKSIKVIFDLCFD